MSPAGHAAPAALDAGHRPMGAHPGHSAGCSIALTGGAGGAGLPHTRAQGGLLPAPLGVGMLCSASASRCIHFGGGRRARGDAALPCACQGSCWQRSCGTRCIVMLPSGFCPHCGARGPGRRGPWLPKLPPPSRPWAQLCPLSQGSGRGLAVGLLGWSWGWRQPLASRNRQRVPTPCWSLQEKHTDGQP